MQEAIAALTEIDESRPDGGLQIYHAAAVDIVDEGLLVLGGHQEIDDEVSADNGNPLLFLILCVHEDRLLALCKGFGLEFLVRLGCACGFPASLLGGLLASGLPARFRARILRGLLFVALLVRGLLAAATATPRALAPRPGLCAISPATTLYGQIGQVLFSRNGLYGQCAASARLPRTGLGAPPSTSTAPAPSRTDRFLGAGVIRRGVPRFLFF